MRWFVLMVSGLLVLPLQAASLRDMQLQGMLEQVAEASSEGTPRRINNDMIDEGYSVRGTELINFLSVQPGYAQSMQEEPLIVRNQLQAAVCADQRFRRLLDLGATLTYHFVLTETAQPVLTQQFIAEHCQAM
ncbi:PA3611 family quorum-sensing-regulated virulence factor [Pseudomonas sp.]|uniref:PA3611 family quorum-sensing-regulated virulence factor n=1 Tax=Pseudomonas sp. TaxID=306 RepID=UPI002729923A|nr:PA3611 family quorum-sensing-regulated virulence factor [Pseudomonas sp.]